jgi:hypothetical protein
MRRHGDKRKVRCNIWMMRKNDSVLASCDVSFQVMSCPGINFHAEGQGNTHTHTLSNTLLRTCDIKLFSVVTMTKPGNSCNYEGVSKRFRTGRLEPELQMLQLPATRCSCIAILWVSLVSFAAITLYVSSQRVIPKVYIYFVNDSIRKIWINPRM